MLVPVVRPCRALLALGLAVALALAILPVITARAAVRPHGSARAASHHIQHARKHSPSVGAASAVCPDATLVPSGANLDRVAAATLCLVNQQRAASGLTPLRANAGLAAAAAKHSLDMVAQDYFDHVGPAGDDPLSRMRASGYVRPNHGYAIGENIAAATGSSAAPDAIVAMWMNSPGHRANILSPAFRDTGMGVAAAAPTSLGAGAGGTYTEEFGTIS